MAAALDGLAGRAALRLWQLRLHAPTRGGAVASPPREGAHGFRAPQPDAKRPGEYAWARSSDDRAGAAPDVPSQHPGSATRLFVARLGGDSCSGAPPGAAGWHAR